MALLGRDTAVTGPFPKGVLLLETLRGSEALGMPYLFDVALLSKEPAIAADDVIGKPLAVAIKLNGKPPCGLSVGARRPSPSMPKATRWALAWGTLYRFGAARTARWIPSG